MSFNEVWVKEGCFVQYLVNDELSVPCLVVMMDGRKMLLQKVGFDERKDEWVDVDDQRCLFWEESMNCKLIISKLFEQLRQQYINKKIQERHLSNIFKHLNIIFNNNQFIFLLQKEFVATYSSAPPLYCE
jgi:hypothetical protein